MAKMFKGCGTALLTPFLSSGEPDYEAYSRLVDRQVEGGVNFLVPLGTTAETPALSPAEKVKLLEITKQRCGSLPLIAGVGSNSLPGTLAAIDLLAPCLSPKDGDALLVVVPFYNKPTQEGMYAYFKAVTEYSPLPIIVYNVPGRTGANMLPSTVLRLATEVPGIVGIKEASGNYAQASEILRSAPEDFSVLSGDDAMTFPLMATGASGVISVASNVAPAMMSAMTGALLKGDFASARELHFRLSPLFDACFVESNPIPAKAALSILGLCGDTMRLPLSPASAKTVDRMESVLKALDL